jgi:hypothetical protein
VFRPQAVSGVLENNAGRETLGRGGEWRVVVGFASLNISNHVPSPTLLPPPHPTRYLPLPNYAHRLMIWKATLQVRVYTSMGVLLLRYL